MDDTLSRNEGARKQINLRREPRQELVRSVFYKGDKALKYWAMSVDVSTTGLCIFTNRPVAPGEELRVASKHIWSDERTIKAVWSRKLNNDLYRAGFCLISDL